ncbi:MAG: hypothetical protein HY663_00815 [Chloroflexi bacterium]|nr:hypothetical protein [Chloroflexota bacterium]
MPKNASHKMAARQAQLSKKKKKGKPNITNVHIPSDKGASVSGSVIKSAGSANDDLKSGVSSRTSAAIQATTKKEKASASAMAAYSYVGPEVRRIAIVTALMLAIIIALTFVLK